MTNKNLDNETKWIRSLLAEWGVWRRQEHGLLIPAKARLLTGGGDIMSTSEGLELTNLAVMHLRSVSRPHYTVIRAIYHDYPGDRYEYILKKLPVDAGVESKRQMSEMRQYAEAKIASYRQGAVAA